MTRQVEYISPSSLKVIEENQDAYYLRYLAKNRPPKSVQTQPMCVGSAFDAYVKSYLHEALFGVGADPKYAFEAIFEAQVEACNRDFARIAGKIVFDTYKKYGALSDLMLELQKSVGKPRFEFAIQGVIEGRREGVSGDFGVPLLGKPDVFFINDQGARVVLDWKVNGYCSKSEMSPMKGYVKIRPSGAMHKDCQPMIINGMMVNITEYLENCNEEWACQLAIYSWLLGEDVGSQQCIFAVDQIVGRPDAIRVASHRLRISRDFQHGLMSRLIDAWSLIQEAMKPDGHYFRNMSIEDSQKRCELLEQQAIALQGSGSAEDQWFANITRG